MIDLRRELNICASVIWYDEPDDSLYRLIRSLAGIVRSAVFVDGAYAMFPHKSFSSPVSQHESIRSYCSSYGISCRIIECGMAWEDQCSKRTIALNSAAINSDYVLNIDADESISISDKKLFLDKVLRHSPDTIKVSLETPPPAGKRQAYGLGVQPSKSSTSITGRGIERFYRSHLDFVCGPRHHGNYYCVDETGRGMIVRHISDKDKAGSRVNAVSLDMKHVVEIVNDSWSRSNSRLKSKHSYGAERARRRVDI